MEIVSWNCHNGLGINKAKVILAKFSKADIFVIQECRREDIYAFECDWKFKNWYGDDQEYSDLGIAVFSRNHEIEFTDAFSRKFRYVVPYTVKTEKPLTLFTVWTKPVPFYYDKNVTQAICSTEYKDLINRDVIIIGDFNTGHSEEHPEYYSDLCGKLNRFKNCASGKQEESKKTFYSYKMNKLYLNDFCFVSEALYTNIQEIKIHDDWKENAYGQKSWCGLSDHCPISVDFNFNHI